MSKIDAIQQMTADTSKLPLLIEMCDTYPIVFEIIWALSFNATIQEQLRCNTSFMTKLAHPPKSGDPDQLRKATNGILWNLEFHHDDRDLSEDSNPAMFDIMISYSHKDKVVCRQIYDALIQIGYRVWIDFDQMHGNVMDAMAQGIERSQIILICMSEQYRRSNYCRAEAHYAFQRQLKLVPVLIQAHYQPDGWLLFLIGQLLYIDFTKDEFSRAMGLLTKELEALTTIRRRTLSSPLENELPVETNKTSIKSESALQLVLPDKILDWSSIHVHEWLINHNLTQLSQLFEDFDGRSLLYMNESIKTMELQQAISMLQEDALRRTKQSLSLVELTHFRSLMDRKLRHLSNSTAAMRLSNRQRLVLKRRSLVCCQIS